MFACRHLQLRLVTAHATCLIGKVIVTCLDMKRRNKDVMKLLFLFFGVLSFMHGSNIYATCSSTHARAHAHTRTHATRRHTHIHTHTRTHTRTHVHTHARMHIAGTHVLTHARTRTHARTHTHTNTSIINRSKRSSSSLTCWVTQLCRSEASRRGVIR